MGDGFGFNTMYDSTRGALDAASGGGPFDKPGMPPAPDYEAVAQEQGQQNILGAITGAALANPTTYTPFSTSSFTNPAYEAAMQSWQQSGGSPEGRPNPADFAQPGQFQRNVTLSPEIQALFNRAGQQPLDFSGFQDIAGGADANRKRVEDALYRRSTQFLDERRGAREADLLNRGLNMGSQGYNENLAQFDTQYADAADRAILGGGAEASRIFGENLQTRQQQIAELLRQRSLPFEEYARIAQFLPPSPGQGNAVAGAPVFDAANNAYNTAMQGYNIQAGQAGNNLQAGTSILTALMALSDRRLKSNVVRVGTHPLSIGIYEYDIGGKRAMGVMADEVEKVMPDAVVTRPDGYKMVNYGLL